MQKSGRFEGTLSYVYARWPLYLFGYGGAVAAILAIIILSVEQGWWGFVFLAFALLIIVGYFLLASLWAAYKIYDQQNGLDYQHLYEMAEVKPTDRIVCVELGLRRTAMALGRNLTSGRLMAIDVYNPHLTPDWTLSRWRAQTLYPEPDPRLIWREGRFDLLPLPDNSVSAVFLCQTLSAFAQEGDRLCLLRELFRILLPGGSLLFSERARSRTNLLALGPAALVLEPAGYWRNLIQKAGFQPRQEVVLHDLVYCLRAGKPIPDQGRQLRLKF